MKLLSTHIVIITCPGFARRIFLLLLFAIFFANTHAQNQLVDDSLSLVPNGLNPNETLKQLSIAQLRFFKSNDRQINFGLTGSQFYYAVLKINSGKADSDSYLSIDNTNLDSVAIYRINENTGDSLVYTGGQQVKFDASGNYVWHIIPLQLTNRPSWYLLALKSAQKNINIHYDISGEDELLQKYMGYERFIFFYMGIAFFIAAIISFAFLIFRKQVFLNYLAYVICCSIWIMSHYGITFPNLYPHTPTINTIIKPLSSLSAGFFLLKVLESIFSQNQISRKQHFSLKQMQNIVLISMLFMLFLLLPSSAPGITIALIVMWHLTLISVIVMVSIMAFKYFRNSLRAKIFSIAILVICTTTVLQILSNIGFISNHFFNQHGMALGSLLENSIMAFGLFWGLLQERKMKDQHVSALEAEQSSILKKLITVEDKERKRIAADLHDNIGPLLAALKINFRRFTIIEEESAKMELVEKTESIIDDSIIEIRNLAHNLMPRNLSSKGLTNTLSDYFEDIGQLYNKRIRFEHNIQTVFEPELQMNIYRIMSELVLNAAKHSGAQKIRVSMHSNLQQLIILIHDNGQGFESKINGNKTSFGIQSAESRVNYLNGTFMMESSPGKGTTINIKTPL